MCEKLSVVVLSLSRAERLIALSPGYGPSSARTVNRCGLILKILAPEGLLRHDGSVLQVAIEPRIEPALGDQLAVLALFGDAPAIEHQHPIGLLNRRQAMRDD